MSNSRLIQNVTCYVLGASIILGLQNVKQNIDTYNQGKMKQATKLAGILNLAMVVSSTMQLLNQLLFIIPSEVPIPEGAGWDFCNG